MTQAGAKKTDFSRTYSLCARTRDGGTVTLVFPENISAQDFQTAHLLFSRLLARHRASVQVDALTRGLDAVENPLPSSRRHDIVHYNPATRELELIDVFASSRLRRRITVPLQTGRRGA